MHGNGFSSLLQGWTHDTLRVVPERSVQPLRVIDPDFRSRLAGASLATAEILYHLPDHPRLVQVFIWQTLDEAPCFTRIRTFLDFWRNEIEATIEVVRIAHSALLKPAEWRSLDELHLH